MKTDLIKAFILENRSLAENNPLNLVGIGSAEVDNFFNKVKKEYFIKYVNRVLDANE